MSTLRELEAIQLLGATFFPSETQDGNSQSADPEAHVLRPNGNDPATDDLPVYFAHAIGGPVRHIESREDS